jgi:molybdopterin converting factor subunit 1
MAESTPEAYSSSETTQVRVQVLLFSVLRDRVGTDALPVSLDTPATGTDLLDQLVAEYPSIEAYRSVVRLAVNQSYVPADTRLHDGDEVALITPVSGG